ncbi:MAG: hypothetical protein KDE32_06145 [Novosphingobium sp.]|nr:hypothetical protein [Novosphingobium sp.]
MIARYLFPISCALTLAACSASSESETPPADAELPSKEDTRLVSFLNEKYLDVAPIEYRAGRVDLDGDGTDEVLAYVGGSLACGTGGCPFLVLKDDGKTFKVVTEASVTQLPLGVLDTSTNGWRDLWVTIYGGGAKQETKKLTYDGKTYPDNPTVAPAETIATPGTEIIAEGDLIKVD